MEPYKIYIRPGIVLAVPGVVYPGCFDRRVFTYVDPDIDCGAALQDGIPENLISCTEGGRPPLFCFWPGWFESFNVYFCLHFLTYNQI